MNKIKTAAVAFGALVVLGACTATLDEGPRPSTDTASSPNAQPAQEPAVPAGDPAQQPEQPAPPTAEKPNAEKPKKQAKPSETVSQQNARKSAASYIDFGGFSRKGLIDQLKFEGFNQADAVYGADNCGAKWRDEAAESAKNYLEVSAFSRQGLLDQLKFEGFTEEQAQYGVAQTGL